VNKKKIIIGIPTYNRQEKCWSLIEQLCSIKNIFDFVQLVVVDNSTTNPKKLEELINKFGYDKNIIYFHNEKNKGHDFSILRLVNFAILKSSKIWFLTDDDKIFSEEFLGYVKFIQCSNAKVNLCNFDFEFDNDKTKNILLDKKNAYLRASFLPTISIDPYFLNLTEIKNLCGTNYVQIAIINSLISSYEEINLYDRVVGIQKMPKINNWNFKNTYVEGYLKCMQWKNILSVSEIKLQTTIRIRGYLGSVIKNYRKFNKHEHLPNEVFKTGIAIFKHLGLINFFYLLPRIVAWFIISFKNL